MQHKKYSYLLEQSRNIINKEVEKYFLILEKEKNQSKDTTLFYINSYYITGNHKDQKPENHFLIFDEMQLLYLLTAPEKNNPRTSIKPLKQAFNLILDYILLSGNINTFKNCYSSGIIPKLIKNLFNIELNYIDLNNPQKLQELKQCI